MERNILDKRKFYKIQSKSTIYGTDCNIVDGNNTVSDAIGTRAFDPNKFLKPDFDYSGRYTFFSKTINATEITSILEWLNDMCSHEVNVGIVSHIVKYDRYRDDKKYGMYVNINNYSDASMFNLVYSQLFEQWDSKLEKEYIEAHAPKEVVVDDGSGKGVGVKIIDDD